MRRLAGASLAGLAAVQLAHALLGAPLVAGACGLDPAWMTWLRLGRSGVAAVAFGVVGVALSAAALAGAGGILSGRQWGWYLGVGCAALWLPTTCAPLSLLVLGLLLHPRVRGAIGSGG